MSIQTEFIKLLNTPKMAKLTKTHIKAVLSDPEQYLKTLHNWHTVNSLIKLNSNAEIKQKWAEIKMKHYRRLYNAERYYKNKEIDTTTLKPKNRRTKG